MQTGKNSTCRSWVNRVAEDRMAMTYVSNLTRFWPACVSIHVSPTTRGETLSRKTKAVTVGFFIRKSLSSWNAKIIVLTEQTTNRVGELTSQHSSSSRANLSIIGQSPAFARAMSLPKYEYIYIRVQLYAYDRCACIYRFADGFPHRATCLRIFYLHILPIPFRDYCRKGTYIVKGQDLYEGYSLKYYNYEWDKTASNTFNDYISTTKTTSIA